MNQKRELYSVVEEWRRAKFTDQLLTHLERDLILESKDKGRRNEARDGEAYALVCQGRGRASQGRGVPSLFCPLSLLHVQPCLLVAVSFNMLIQSNQHIMRQDLWEVRFSAILAPAGSFGYFCLLVGSLLC